jgi:hypothetical protein
LGGFGEAGAAHRQTEFVSVPSLTGHIAARDGVRLVAVGIRLRVRVDTSVPSIAVRMPGLMRTVIDQLSRGR